MVFAVGAILILIGLWGGIDWVKYDGTLQLKMPYKRDLLDFFPRRPEWWQSLFHWGCVLAVVGAWLAWFFSPTIGRLARWIRQG